jgi:predicted transcriptional regulator
MQVNNNLQVYNNQADKHSVGLKEGDQTKIQVGSEEEKSDSDSSDSKVESIQLLTLVAPYSNLELPELNLNGKKIHLYPTKNVSKTFCEMTAQRIHGLAKIAILNKCFSMDVLKVSEDTTMYYSDEQIEKLTSTLKDNTIYRNGSPLKDGHYIFVINTNDDLITDCKRITKDGRVQHSSLARGKPVKAAGMLKVITDKITGIQKLYIKNASGHYQPTPESLNVVLKWLSNSNFRLVQDEIQEEEFGPLRTIELSS